jgi:hypothetical protein
MPSRAATLASAAIGGDLRVDAPSSSAFVFVAPGTESVLVPSVDVVASVVLGVLSGPVSDVDVGVASEVVVEEVLLGD